MPIGLHIVTPHGEVHRADVASVVLPGSEGDFGVLPEHERFLTPLRIGELEIDTGREVLYASIGYGFADVSGREVVVLVDSCELAADIDVARAELARERAEQRLAQLVDETEERYREFEQALELAKNRIAVSGRAGRARSRG
jgi:F-type H+-transporting ATPase subunit epsilon